MFNLAPGFIGSGGSSAFPAHLVSRWKLSETSGTAASDSGPGGFNGIYVSGVTLGATGLMSADTHVAASFDGSSGYVDLSSPAGLNALSRNFSVESWIKPTAGGAGTYRGIFSAAQGGIYLRIDATTNALAVIKSRVANIATGATVLTGGSIWHVVFTIDASGNYVGYVNGASEFSGTTTQTFLGGVVSIGADANASGVHSEFFAGVIGEVSVFDIALTSSEVAARYAANS